MTKKWEYMIAKTENGVVQLGAYGAKGWELVSVVLTEQSSGFFQTTIHKTFFFKRPVTEPKTEE